MIQAHAYEVNPFVSIARSMMEAAVIQMFGNTQLLQNFVGGADKEKWSPNFGAETIKIES